MPKVDAVSETSTSHKLFVPGSQDISNVVPELPVAIETGPSQPIGFDDRAQALFSVYEFNPRLRPLLTPLSWPSRARSSPPWSYL